MQSSTARICRTETRRATLCKLWRAGAHAGKTRLHQVEVRIGLPCVNHNLCIILFVPYSAPLTFVSYVISRLISNLFGHGKHALMHVDTFEARSLSNCIQLLETVPVSGPSDAQQGNVHDTEGSSGNLTPATNGSDTKVNQLCPACGIPRPSTSHVCLVSRTRM